MKMKKGEKVKDLDFRKIQSQLVTRIRGQKSQQQLNKQMGYSFNKVAKWESGTNKITWEDFLLLLEYQKIDILDYFRVNFNYEGELNDTSSLIFHIVGQIPSDILASSLEISRSKVYRLFSSESPFYLEDILKMIFLADSYFLDLIRVLTRNEPIEELDHFYDYVENQDIFFYFPETATILSCLELRAYKELDSHSNEFLSQKSGIEPTKVVEIISKLESKEMIVKEDSKYTVVSKNSMLETEPEEILKNKLFWLKKHQQLMGKKLAKLNPKDESLKDYGYVINALTPEAKKEVKKRISRFYQELVSILSSDINGTSDDVPSKKEDICLIHIGMLSLMSDEPLPQNCSD